MSVVIFTHPELDVVYNIKILGVMLQNKFWFDMRIQFTFNLPSRRVFCDIANGHLLNKSRLCLMLLCCRVSHCLPVRVDSFLKFSLGHVMDCCILGWCPVGAFYHSFSW